MFRTPKSLTISAALLAVLVLPQLALAEDDAVIVTDRPDVAESSETVGAWRVQVETAGDLESQRQNGKRTTQWRTPTKLRVGLASSFELHVETDGFTHSSDDGDLSESGMSDLDVGFKVHLFAGGGLWPSTGVLLALTLPVGADALSGDTYLLSPTLAFDWELSSTWGLGINVGVTAAIDNRDEQTDTFRWAASLGRTLAPFVDTLRIYVEGFGEHGENVNLVAMDGGVTWLITPSIQLDLSARAGFTNDAPDVGGALGLSFKI